MLTPHNLTCEYFTNPMGLDVQQPRLSWKSRSTQRCARQTAYQIAVVDNPTLFADPSPDSSAGDLLWDSSKFIRCHNRL